LSNPAKRAEEENVIKEYGQQPGTAFRVKGFSVSVEATNDSLQLKVLFAKAVGVISWIPYLYRSLLGLVNKPRRLEVL
jgi:hypothetical protein